MSRDDDLVRDPWEWLRSGYESWAASPSWTITMQDQDVDDESVAGVVRPGVQWFRADVMGNHEVLVRGDTAYVRGANNLLALAGWNTDPEKAARALGGRWVSLPAASWLRRARDHSALGWFGKGLGEDPDDYDVELLDASAQHDGVTARLRTDAGVLTVHRPDHGPVTFVELTARTWTLRWTFDDRTVDVPAPTAEDVLILPELLTALGRNSRRRPQRSRPATVEILAPDEPGDGWCLHSDDLARAFGVDGGHDAEALALQHIAQQRPDLVHLVEGDSYDTVFSAYVSTEETARTIATILRTATTDK
jgi:hypothetical protein